MSRIAPLDDTDAAAENEELKAKVQGPHEPHRLE